MEYCSTEKKNLIEEIGLHFERIHQLSPLAARIYAIMILCSQDGHTFDEIVSITEASKSTVSTQLNLLTQLKKVDYFTKSGDRKRYFKASQTYMTNTLKDYLENVKRDIDLIEKITTYNSTHNAEKFEKNGKTSLLFKDYLLSHQENLEKTIKEMSNLRTSNI